MSWTKSVTNSLSPLRLEFWSITWAGLLYFFYYTSIWCNIYLILHCFSYICMVFMFKHQFWSAIAVYQILTYHLFVYDRPFSLRVTRLKSSILGSIILPVITGLTPLVNWRDRKGNLASDRLVISCVCRQPSLQTFTRGKAFCGAHFL